MAVRSMLTFEVQDKEWFSGTVTSHDTAHVHKITVGGTDIGGSYAGKLSNTGTATKYLDQGEYGPTGIPRALANGTGIVDTKWRGYIYLEALPAANEVRLIGVNSGTSLYLLGLFCASDGTAKLYDKAATPNLLASSPASTWVVGWNTVRVELTGAGTATAAWSVTVNGWSTNGSGYSTTPSSNKIDRVRIGKSNAVDETLNIWVDDCVLDDTNTPAAGVGILKTLTGDGHYPGTDWTVTPGGTSPFANVLKNTPPTTTNYIQSTVSGAKYSGPVQQNSVFSIPAGSTVNGVEVLGVASVGTGGAIRLLAYDSATDLTQSSDYAGTSAVVLAFMMDSPPGGGSWILGGTDSIEIGALDNSAGTQIARLDDVYLIMDILPQSSLPGVPSNLSPAESANVAAGSVTIQCDAVTGATHYQYDLDSAGWSADQVGHTHAESLSAGDHTHRWRAKNGSGYGDPSSLTTFHVIAVPGVPTLDLPADGANVLIGDNVYSWIAGAGTADYHKIQFDSDSAIEVRGSLNYTKNYAGAGDHTWKVLAGNDVAGDGSYTAARTVHVVSDPTVGTMTASALIALIVGALRSNGNKLAPNADGTMDVGDKTGFSLSSANMTALAALITPHPIATDSQGRVPVSELPDGGLTEAKVDPTLMLGATDIAGAVLQDPTRKISVTQGGAVSVDAIAEALVTSMAGTIRDAIVAVLNGTIYTGPGTKLALDADGKIMLQPADKADLASSANLAALSARLPSALDGGLMPVVEKSYPTGTVTAVTSAAVFTTNKTEDSGYWKPPCLVRIKTGTFTGGASAVGCARRIRSYRKTGSGGEFTVDAFPLALVVGATFVIVN